MLHFVFGELQDNAVTSPATPVLPAILVRRARVRWFLSIDINDVPASAREQGQRTFRSITVDGHEIEFSSGFTDLHTRSYEEILAGRGFGLEENRVAIDTVATIRSAKVKGGAEQHPYLAKMRK